MGICVAGNMMTVIAKITSLTCGRPGWMNSLSKNPANVARVSVWS